ncbi:CoA pyrophosphatase [Falsirhodobacter halotolerans]|uniref:CoA pyrophosphatase n=1 Tax=Falsirhodobacter halotolerans TaxID=1146892 RepID=UPI001FD5FE6A|nr:CoA pyrophosphatase [Falsirhodobacter halotolerans]MCJ8138320.1 CoA pyrophosphatase [Falsirhodobacter halotolerans]
MTPDALTAALTRPAPPDPAGPWPVPDILRPAAVLLAVEGDRLWLTKRATGLAHHPGQIALPGGKVDPTDADAVACALRESQEEIGLPPASVCVLGALPPHPTVTGFTITPVVGLLHTRFTPRPEVGEVAEVFAVPLTHILDPASYRLESRIWGGRTRRYWVAPWGPYYIWGATAGILRDLAVRVG